MCVLVEMWTGKMPWCSREERSQPSIMLMVSSVSAQVVDLITRIVQFLARVQLAVDLVCFHIS